MKVLILAAPSSTHTVKWVRSLSLKGIEIFLFGLTDYNVNDYSGLENFYIFSSKLNKEIFSLPETALSKLSYLKSLPKIKKIIKEFKPDILHAHYASSYGILAALTNFHPMIISVYGSDVFNFPHTNILSAVVFKFNLSRADKILSTSHIMAEETNKYTSKKIEVTPFGIDTTVFKHIEVNSIFERGNIVIGTIKALENKYGIKYLLQAFKYLKEKYSDIPLKLLIVGEGSQEIYLKRFSEELNINEDTVFTGYIKHEEVPKYHNMIDIFVSLSIEESESFGVAVLEASACERPVIVSDAGGLPEVVEDNITGFIVERKNYTEAVSAIGKLLHDPSLRKQMGIKGRERVEKFYNWNENVDQMFNIYSDMLNE